MALLREATAIQLWGSVGQGQTDSDEGRPALPALPVSEAMVAMAWLEFCARGLLATSEHLRVRYVGKKEQKNKTTFLVSGNLKSEH